MQENSFVKAIDNITKSYASFVYEKNNQSLFYFDQMLELFSNEISAQVVNNKSIDNIIKNTYQKNILLIFNNMNSYLEEVIKKSCEFINQYIRVGVSNRYVDADNLNHLYKKFFEEITLNLDIKDKIITLVSTNTDIFVGQLYTKFLFYNSLAIDDIIVKYKNIFADEMISNITSKRDYLLGLYQDFIDNISKDFYENKNEIATKNKKLITNAAYNLLKDEEYIVINKYIDLNMELIQNTFKLLEKELKEAGVNKIKDTRSIRDYLCGFNNTVCVKIKKIFDEMNMIVVLDNEEINDKVNGFNDLITHIFEMNLIFDKQFYEYKKSFSFLNNDENKINKIVDIKNRDITLGIKNNIFNIFRENIRLYNNVVYNTLLLRSKAGDYNVILDIDKIKDLLLK